MTDLREGLQSFQLWEMTQVTEGNETRRSGMVSDRDVMVAMFKKVGVKDLLEHQATPRGFPPCRHRPPGPDPVMDKATTVLTVGDEIVFYFDRVTGDFLHVETAMQAHLRGSHDCGEWEYR